MVAVVLLAQNSCKFALGVFHLMPFIDNDVFPIVFVESESVLEDKVVGRYTDIPFSAFHRFLDLISGGRISSVDYFAD